jgi:hypothetical protein
LRVLALGIFLGIVGVAFINSRRPKATSSGSSSRAQVGPQTPYQAQTDELFRVNASLPSDPALASDYQSINLQYFGGRLPAIGVRWEPRLAQTGPLIAAGFEMEGMTNGRFILLNPSLQNDEEQLRRTLVHEMVHVAVKGQTTEEHGAVFQSRLRELSEQGAFVGTVATEEEKQELHRTVEARMEEVKKTATSLHQAFAELQAEQQQALAARPTSAAEAAAEDLRRRNLQDRGIDYNFSVQRHNNSIAELNRLIEQYNLMTSYPDGLDRERLKRPVFTEVK